MVIIKSLLKDMVRYMVDKIVNGWMASLVGGYKHGPCSVLYTEHGKLVYGDLVTR